MQKPESNLQFGQPQKSSGLIRGAIIGAVLLLAVFGLLAVFNKLDFSGDNVAQAPVVSKEDEDKKFTRLTSEWSAARDGLQTATKAQASINTQVAEMRAKTAAQEAISKEVETSFSRAVDRVSTAKVKLDEAENDMARFLDDSLERKVATAVGAAETYTKTREQAEQAELGAFQEAERIKSAVVQLRLASNAAKAAAEATANVANAADAAQIIVDQNEDAVPDSDGSTLLNLRNDFFNEAKAQADSAQRSSQAAERAMNASTQKLEEAEARVKDRKEAVIVARSDENQAQKELADLAKQLENLQKQRTSSRKVAAIAKERLLSEESGLEKRKADLTNATLKSEDLKASYEDLIKKRDTADAKVGAAQQIYDDAEAKLRDAQKLRAKRIASDVASVNSEMHDRLRAKLGNLRIENPDHDRFIVSSEALFKSGSAELGESGKILITDMASVITAVTDKLSKDADWILRVDGHTDNTPFKGNGRFRDNWELSQARALAVVKYIVSLGNIPPERLAANGLGEYQPLKKGNSEKDKAENRRIELALVPR